MPNPPAADSKTPRPVQVVLNAEQKAIVRAAANRDGLSLSAFVRSAVLRAANLKTEPG